MQARIRHTPLCKHAHLLDDLIEHLRDGLKALLVRRVLEEPRNEMPECHVPVHHGAVL